MRKTFAELLHLAIGESKFANFTTKELRHWLDANQEITNPELRRLWSAALAELTKRQGGEE